MDRRAKEIEREDGEERRSRGGVGRPGGGHHGPAFMLMSVSVFGEGQVVSVLATGAKSFSFSISASACFL